MKLSMWMCVSAIQKQWSIESHINTGLPTISGFRSFVIGADLHGEYAYIGSPEQLGIHSTYTSVLAFGSDYVLVDTVPSVLVNFLLDYFDWMSTFDSKLREASQQDQPFQAITDLVNQLFHYPIIIVDNYFQVLGISGEMDGESWDYMKLHRVSPPGFIGRYIHEDRFLTYMTGHIPTIHTLPSYALWKASLRVNCFFDDSAMCRINVSLESTDVDKGFVQLIQHVGVIVEQIPTTRLHRFLLEDVVNDSSLFDSCGEIKPDDKLYIQLKTSVGDDPFYLCRFRMKGKSKHKELYYWMCGRLDAIFPGSQAFPYKEDIIMLVPSKEQQREKMIQLLPPLLDQTGFYGIVSNQCENLKYFREVYLQTSYPTESEGENSTLVFFDDYSSQLLIQEIAKQKDWNAWIHKGILRLAQYDRTHKSNYLKTLDCLISNHFILTNTASALFIHRNSLQYRLNRIEEIMGCNPLALEKRFYLTISCKLYMLSQGAPKGDS